MPGAEALKNIKSRNTKHKNTINLMRERRLLLGDEAIALGAVHAGLSGCYAYPGTPSTEITEFVQGDALARARGIHYRCRPMRKQPWRKPSECRIWASVP